MKLRSLLFVLLLLSAAPVWALELPLLFSDGAVLQRDRPITLWGEADPGSRIRIEFDGARHAARADAAGHWRLQLPARSAGGPYLLRVTAGGQTRLIRDLWVGDVWLASGQSNMEWPIAQSADAELEIARATDAAIRHFKIPRAWSGSPEAQLSGGRWIASTPEVAGEFSAVAHFFARNLRAEVAVPIGIIDSTWGGSRIEAWMDADSLELDPDAIARDAAQARAADERALAETRRRLAAWPASGDESDWASADLDESSWSRIAVPGLWESDGWVGMDGVAWYRTRFSLTREEVAHDLRLGLGRIDDSDVAFVNGRQIGATTQRYNQPRIYRVPAALLRAGENVLALRVTDTGGGGGIHGPVDELFLQPDGGVRRPLPEAWSFRVAQASVSGQDDGKNHLPTLLYNAMIHPLQPFALRGVIWYQGESNANGIADAQRYRTLFPTLIRQWRSEWGAPELPFLWVQLASFGSGADEFAGDAVQRSPWATLREAQSAALLLPATGQVIAIDIGDADDIHPRNKQEVGRRLALEARRVAYGESASKATPRFRKVSFDAAAARVYFEPAETPLAVRGGGAEVQGFTLAGADGIFHAAEARLEHMRVVVRSAAVPAPTAVRYAWRDDASAANLVDGTGLPVPPFRSDRD